jgi:hypothetical protein
LFTKIISKNIFLIHSAKKEGVMGGLYSTPSFADEKKLDIKGSKILTKENGKILTDILFLVLPCMPKELCCLISAYSLLPVPYHVCRKMESPNYNCLSKHSKLGYLFFKSTDDRAVGVWSSEHNWSLIDRVKIRLDATCLTVCSDTLFVLGFYNLVAINISHSNPEHWNIQRNVWKRKRPADTKFFFKEMVVDENRCFISDRNNSIFYFSLSRSSNNNYHFQLQTQISMESYINSISINQVAGDTIIWLCGDFIQIFDNQNRKKGKHSLIHGPGHYYYRFINGLHCTIRDQEIHVLDLNCGVNHIIKNPDPLKRNMADIDTIDNLIFVYYCSFTYVIHHDLLFGGG